MSRRSIEPKKMPLEELKEIIRGYACAKAHESEIKKTVSELGGTIKQEFKNHDIKELEVGDIKASISVTPKEDFNELQAIEILRRALTPEQFSKCVKTREYIDDDEFEKMVYAHEVDASILAPATTPLEPTVTLRLGKVKKK